MSRNVTDNYCLIVCGTWAIFCSTGCSTLTIVDMAVLTETAASHKTSLQPLLHVRHRNAGQMSVMSWSLLQSRFWAIPY